MTINSTQKSDPDKDLDLGAKFPFDETDVWWEDGYDHLPPSVAPDWSVAAARGVIANLEDRRSIKQGFNEIAEDVRVEIVATLAAIIRRAKERDDVWRWSAPVMLERAAPEPRMKSVTVTVNFEE